MAFSPDGKLLATAGGDGPAAVESGYLAGRRRSLRAGTGPQVSVNGVAFSPDGKLLASAEHDGYVRLWDPATRQAVGAPFLAAPAAA